MVERAAHKQVRPGACGPLWRGQQLTTVLGRSICIATLCLCDVPAVHDEEAVMPAAGVPRVAGGACGPQLR